MDSYFVVDHERRIVAFNECFVQMLNLRPSQRRGILGTPCHGMLRLEICRDNCIALECLAKSDHVRREEIRGVSAAGRELVLELSAIPLRDAEGRVAGVLVTHRDVTDERRLKTRHMEEREALKSERETLLKIIKERDEELESLRQQLKTRA